MFALSAHPGQGVTHLEFSSRENSELLVSSWDCTLRLYDVASNTAKATHTYSAPILDCCFTTDGQYAFAAGLDRSVHSVNLERGIRGTLAPNCHDKGISSLAYSTQYQSLYSASWDGSLGVLDPRSTAHTATSLLNRLQLGEGQIHSISTAGFSLVAAVASKKAVIFDVRYLSAPLEVRASPLKMQLRRVAMHPDGKSFVLGSTEGRCAIEYVDSGSVELQSLKYAFKCHRQGDVLYPVNAIAFHPAGTFATGGSDGAVCVWDGARKKRQLALPPLTQPVSALAFSKDGRLMAIAASRTFEESREGDPLENNIFVRFMQETETQAKRK